MKNSKNLFNKISKHLTSKNIPFSKIKDDGEIGFDLEDLTIRIYEDEDNCYIEHLDVLHIIPLDSTLVELDQILSTI